MNCIDSNEDCVRTSRLETTNGSVMFPIWSLCDVPDLVEVGAHALTGGIAAVDVFAAGRRVFAAGRRVFAAGRRVLAQVTDIQTQMIGIHLDEGPTGGKGRVHLVQVGQGVNEVGTQRSREA
jgi:hypothetical protein